MPIARGRRDSFRGFIRLDETAGDRGARTQFLSRGEKGGPEETDSEGARSRHLTGDYMVTYCPSAMDDDNVFKALADPTRRLLLDLLFRRDGRTLKELQAGVAMTRFGAVSYTHLTLPTKRIV